MNKLIIYSLIVILTGISCDSDEVSPKQAEKFVKYYGGLSTDQGNDVRQLPDGGYFIVGTITVGDNSDIFTLVTDEYGNSKSGLKTFDGNNLNDKASRMQLLDDGGAVAIGTNQKSLGNYDIWILRFNNQGDTVWAKTYGGINNDEGYNLIINQADEIIAIGYTEVLPNEGILNKEFWVHKISKNGTNLWASERELGHPNYDEVANSIIEVDDGYVLVGSRNLKNASRRILFSKLTVQGFYSRITDIPSEYDDQGNMITQLSDGNFLILGTRTDVTTSASDILLFKVEVPSNEFEQIKILDEKVLDDGENELASCFIYHNNRIHILGTTIRSDTRKILLIITDESVNNPMYFKYGLKNIIMEGYGMDYTSDGGYVFTGSNLVLYKIKDSGEL